MRKQVLCGAVLLLLLLTGCGGRTDTFPLELQN